MVSEPIPDASNDSEEIPLPCDLTWLMRAQVYAMPPSTPPSLASGEKLDAEKNTARLLEPPGAKKRAS